MPKKPEDTKDLDAGSIAGSEQKSSRLEWFSHFHMWDFITAQRTRGKPNWFTEKRYPLQAIQLYNRWSNPDELIGVRFKGSKEGTTVYSVIDIDIGSAYHPKTDIESFQAIFDSLEEIGLCRAIVISSSDSGGLHIYFPFEKEVNCYRVAAAFQICLERAGFEIKNGQLEIFPNVKQPRSLHKAHRLPLQAGSFVLDSDFNRVHNSLDRLIESWKIAAQGQDLETFETAIAHAKIPRKNLKGDPAEWKERLEKTLEEGWPEKGHTNRILKEICIYARVFQGLEWDDIECWVLQTVIQLSGYDEFCGHKRQINQRIKEWVKTNRKSQKYYPFGRKIKQKKPPGPNNEDRQLAALERIEKAIAVLKTDVTSWPKTVRERQKLICKQAKCSAQTLYKYRERWHPKFENQSCVTGDTAHDSSIEKDDISIKRSRDYSDSNTFENQSCVTDCQQRAVEILESNVTVIDTTVIEQTSVTGHRETAGAITYLNGETLRKAESTMDSAVTDPGLLSVISGDGQAHHHLLPTGKEVQMMEQDTENLTRRKRKSRSRNSSSRQQSTSSNNHYHQTSLNLKIM